MDDTKRVSACAPTVPVGPVRQATLQSDLPIGAYVAAGAMGVAATLAASAWTD
jgi:hypothetical protein